MMEYQNDGLVRDIPPVMVGVINVQFVECLVGVPVCSRGVNRTGIWRYVVRAKWRVSFSDRLVTLLLQGELVGNRLS